MYGDSTRTQLLARTSAFVALITLGSWISIPFLPIPFTLQTMFVLLAGAIMQRRAVIPVLFYILLGIFNIPVFHNGFSGIGVLLGPTGGYILGFVPAALLVGIAYEYRSSAIRIISIVVATLLILVLGAVWLLYSTSISLPSALLFGIAIFLPGDILKGACVYLTAQRVR
ncbi:MAG: biotin transporter BioY [Methanomicrobiales archaeon]|nr:biotin transporter BioY [Methanomicrobiales archaeon]